MRPTRLRGTCVSLLIFLCANAGAAKFASLPESEFRFETNFEGVDMPGDFRKFDVELYFDPASPDEGRLEVSVDLTAADMGDEEVNEVIAHPAWFASAEFPRAVFVSTDISATSDDEFVARGTLDLKGVKKPVAVPFTWSRADDGAKMAGDFVVRRTDFNVGSGEWSSDESIGLDVRLSFEVGLKRVD